MNLQDFQRDVSWIVKNDKVMVKVPYNISFLLKIKELNLARKWLPEVYTWEFSLEQAAIVQKLLRLYIGADGSGYQNQCDLRVDVVRSNPLLGDTSSGPIIFLGYPIAEASSNKSNVRLLEGIEISTGGFVAGGTPSHWKTKVSNNTSFIIRSVSLDYFNHVIKNYANVIRDGLIRFEVLQAYSSIPVDPKTTKSEENLHSTHHDNRRTHISFFLSDDCSFEELMNIHQEVINLLDNIHQRLKIINHKVKENDQ